MTPIPETASKIRRETTLERLAFALLILVCVVMLFDWSAPDSVGAELKRAQDNGYRAARSQAFKRRLAAVAKDSLASAIRRADAVNAAEHQRLLRAASRAQSIARFTARVDSGPRVIIGPSVPSDSLMALPTVRTVVREFVDSANVALANVRAAAQLERGRASLAIQRLDETIAAQDTLLAATREQLRLVKASKPAWYRRAAGAVVHTVEGVGCGAVGWALGGPVYGIAAGVACSALGGIIR